MIKLNKELSEKPEKYSIPELKEMAKEQAMEEFEKVINRIGF